ncbi:MAG: DNA replication/repair protein RecF [Cyclobacteriaceae bacterium]
MILDHLFLFNFKNIQEGDISFNSKVNAIVGENGSGKTNLLDAIYLLCFTKSAFNSIDSQLIRHGEQGYMVNGTFHKKEEKRMISVGYTDGQKKMVKANKKAYTKIGDHIGQYPSVLVSPYDQDMIHLGSEVRRKFFDAMISQYNATYLDHLIKYNRTLKHRNSLLTQFFEENYFDEILITPFNNQLLESGFYIYETRKAFMIDFMNYFQKWIKRIAQEDTVVDITYEASLETVNFKYHLTKNMQRDIKARRTTIGTHKDDFTFLIDKQYLLKKFGSQGQQKSCILALKLAQYELLKEKTSHKPLLLLDDVLDKLDGYKINMLIQLIKSDEIGQVFVTDPNEARVRSLFAEIENITYYGVNRGEVKKEVLS